MLQEIETAEILKEEKIIILVQQNILQLYLRVIDCVVLFRLTKGINKAMRGSLLWERFNPSDTARLLFIYKFNKYLCEYYKDTILIEDIIIDNIYKIDL